MQSEDTKLVKRPESFGFQSPTPTTALAKETGTASAMVRAQSEIQAAIMMARSNPRDGDAAFTQIIASCRRPTFCEKAAYSFERDGTSIRGASIRLASEINRCWGNMLTGFTIVSETADSVHLRAQVTDLQTNSIRFREVTFKKLIYRAKPSKTYPQTGWVRPDERDLRELVNRQASYAVRNAILESVPPDIVEDALEVVWQTMEDAAKGEIQQDPVQAVRRIAVAFTHIGVTVEMLKTRLGHELSIMSPKELAELRGIYASIKDGHTNIPDHFDIEKKGTAPKTTIDPETGEETPAPKPTQGSKRKIGP